MNGTETLKRQTLVIPTDAIDNPHEKVLTLELSKDQIREAVNTGEIHLTVRQIRRVSGSLRGLSGGRPHVLRPCPRCGEQLNARQMRQHRCTPTASSGRGSGAHPPRYAGDKDDAK